MVLYSGGISFKSRFSWFQFSGCIWIVCWLMLRCCFIVWRVVEPWLRHDIYVYHCTSAWWGHLFIVCDGWCGYDSYYSFKCGIHGPFLMFLWATVVYVRWTNLFFGVLHVMDAIMIGVLEVWDVIVEVAGFVCFSRIMAWWLLVRSMWICSHGRSYCKLSFQGFLFKKLFLCS